MDDTSEIVVAHFDAKSLGPAPLRTEVENVLREVETILDDSNTLNDALQAFASRFGIATLDLAPVWPEQFIERIRSMTPKTAEILRQVNEVFVRASMFDSVDLWRQLRKDGLKPLTSLLLCGVRKKRNATIEIKELIYIAISVLQPVMQPRESEKYCELLGESVHSIFRLYNQTDDPNAPPPPLTGKLDHYQAYYHTQLLKQHILQRDQVTEKTVIATVLPNAAPDAIHSSDFAFVTWYGTDYTFASGVQSAAVRALWDEWEKSGLGLHQDAIRATVDPERDSFRMDTAFRKHPAFGKMIVKAGDGRYRLSKPGEGNVVPSNGKKNSAGITSKARRKRV